MRERFVEQGTAAALVPKPTARVYERKIDGAGEARLVKLACSAPPNGRKRWTLQLLAEKVVELGFAESIARETVRQVLKKTPSRRGCTSSGVCQR